LSNTDIINIFKEPVTQAKKYNIPIITYNNLLNNTTDLISVWSSSSPTVIEKNILDRDNMADTIEIQNTLSTILFM
jgi:hypothetical protein